MPDKPLDIEDSAALLQYLHETQRLDPDETPAITRLTGGVSNRAMLVQRQNGQAWVLKQALPRLRVSVEWLSDPRRIGREAAGIEHLATLAPAGAITPLVFLDAPHHLLAMQAVPQPHQNWKQMLLAGDVEPAHIEEFGALLGRIHRGGWERRMELSSVFDDRSFFESLRLEPYYHYTAVKRPRAAGFLNELVTSTHQRRMTLVHGDYSPKNVLVHEGRLVLLDHEVIHFGEGAFDIGFALAHLLSKAHHLPTHRAKFVEAAGDFYRHYAVALGNVPWKDESESRGVRHALGCMLARCAGRSPLEYLDRTERDRQALVVEKMMQLPPSSIADLIERFVNSIEGM